MFNIRLKKTLKDDNNKKGDQLLIAFVLLLAVLFFGLYLSTNSVTLAIYFFTGIAFGFVLQKSRFCFTAGIRDPYLTGSTALTKAIIMAIALTTIGFTMIKYFAHIKGQIIPGHEYIFPITLATIVGAFLFGIGMVIASGCASGTLMRIGEGFQVHLITLLFFIIGSIWGTHDIKWWNKYPAISKEGVFLPDTIGWLPALLVQLFILSLLYILAHKWGQRDE